MKLIQSYVREKYFVSTIWRDSSDPQPGAQKFYETMVWEWDKETRKRLPKILEQHDSGMFPDLAIEHHAKICVRLAVESPNEGLEVGE